jgi:hypothetical protein
MRQTFVAFLLAAAMALVLSATALADNIAGGF